MAVILDRIGWENGINGENPSGKTPLSAENLKQMENNTEKGINEAISEVSNIQEYDLTSLSTSSVNPTRILCKKVNGIVYISGYIRNSVNFGGGTNYISFENLPQEISVKDTTYIDFSTSTTGAIRGFVNGNKISFGNLASTTFASNGVIAFNFSYVAGI